MRSRPPSLGASVIDGHPQFNDVYNNSRPVIARHFCPRLGPDSARMLDPPGAFPGSLRRLWTLLGRELRSLVFAFEPPSPAVPAWGCVVIRSGTTPSTDRSSLHRRFWSEPEEWAPNSHAFIEPLPPLIQTSITQSNHLPTFTRFLGYTDFADLYSWLMRNRIWTNLL